MSQPTGPGVVKVAAETCPACGGKGLAPRVRAADDEVIGFHPWTCSICRGTGAVRLTPRECQACGDGEVVALVNDVPVCERCMSAFAEATP